MSESFSAFVIRGRPSSHRLIDHWLRFNDGQLSYASFGETTRGVVWLR